jgi:DNA-binding MarR family transcriptional regulator
VTRDADPHDRRGAQVALTPVGLALVDAALASLTELEGELLTDWSPDERDQLASALRRLLVGSLS